MICQFFENYWKNNHEELSRITALTLKPMGSRNLVAI